MNEAPPPAPAEAAAVAAAPSGSSGGEPVAAPSTATIALLSDPAPAPDPRGSLERPVPPPQPTLTPAQEYGRRMASQREFRRYIDEARARMDVGRDKSVLLSGATASLLAKPAAGGALGIVAEGPGQWSGIVGGPAEFATAVWEDAPSWKGGWAALTSADAPDADFTVARAGAILLGRRPTGGYRVRLVAADEEAARVVVRWAEDVPPPGTPAPLGETSPYLVFLLPRDSRPVVFVRARDGAEGPKRK